MLTVHPDYVTSAERLDLYRAVLSRLVEDEQAWKALPCDVSDWWRRRSQSQIREQADGPRSPARLGPMLRSAPRRFAPAAWLSVRRDEPRTSRWSA